ncbi:MAG: hypothetical protein PHV61_02060 [Limnochordia bacterium]|jgi:hypothetical protein|nr:hypothetical protein [Limnochordia bacterium]MDD2628948.1 hypothetical protein [Limnochordia bacterium]MDD2756127.1 hypothetical protein [Methanothrix sp.]MDD4516920.1 hypothetical protein [Limnochordia bacterium]
MDLNVVGMKLDDVQTMAACLGRHPAIIRITRPPGEHDSDGGVLRVVAQRKEDSDQWVLVCANEMEGAS